MNNNVLYNTLNLLKEEINSNYKNRSEIKKTKKEEIERINKKYEKDIEIINTNINIIDKKIREIKEKVRVYSTFETELIGKILCILLSLMEIEEYEIRKIEREVTSYYNSPFGTDEILINKYFTLITKKSDLEHKIFIGGMIDSSSRVVALAECEYDFKERVCLCNMKDDNKLVVDFDYGKYEYIKDFIKKLVLYRYENDIKKITEKDLLIFLNKYIKDNKELIVESNKKRYLEKNKEIDERINALTPKEEINKEQKQRIIPNNNLIDRIGYVFDNQQKMAAFVSPLEIKFKDLLDNVDYKYQGSDRKVKVFLGKILYSTPTTLIAEISLSGKIKYIDRFGDESTTIVNDKGIISIFDLTGRLSNDLNELSFYEWYLGLPYGQNTKISIIDDYLVCIDSKNNFYSSEYNDSLNTDEYDYNELLECRIIYGEKLEDLCNTPEEELREFKIKSRRIN